MYFKQNFATWFLLQAKTILIHLILQPLCLQEWYALRRIFEVCLLWFNETFLLCFSSFYFFRFHWICVYKSARILQKLSYKPDTIFLSWKEIKIRNLRFIMLTYYDKNFIVIFFLKNCVGFQVFLKLNAIIESLFFESL